jgi:transcriptional regulator of acetoin/glycerol metabolism
MSFPLLLKIIEDVTGRELRERIERRVRAELGGQRAYIPGAPAPRRVTDEEVSNALRRTDGNIRRAAGRLGVSMATVRRHMPKRRMVR